MGLDITAYETAVEVPAPEDEDGAWDDGIRRVCGEDWPQSFGASLKAGAWYQTDGAELRFRAGSYSGYNAWRNELSIAVLGVRAETVWADTDAYVGKPFFELIHFSDCEGSIGPDVCVKLAADFKAQREKVLAAFTDDHPDADWFCGRYDDWQKAFELAAAGGGFVDFH